jgi:glycosyltransferase involved in cell wall biosynthesis
MRAGTPIVTFNNGGLAEYVRDAGAGETVDEDPDVLAASVQNLVTDDDLWTTFSRNGAAAVNGVHSAETHVRRILAVYEQAMAR